MKQDIRIITLLCANDRVITDMTQQMGLEDLLMVKFYVVDGISYPACETAIGLFGHHGYHAMKLCRDLGFQDSTAKKSLTLSEFQELIREKERYRSSIAKNLDALNMNPLAYYLDHRGFGVTASENEISMAKLYLADGLSYLRAEESMGLRRKRGFEAMYAVCKLGGFRGPADRKSMTDSDFDTRVKFLGLG